VDASGRPPTPEGRTYRPRMGILNKLLGAADPVTGRTGKSTDPRMRGAGRGRTTRAARGKVPPGSGRFGVSKGRAGAGRGRPTTASGGLSKLLGSLTGRR
jgi:hypothetical protein